MADGQLHRDMTKTELDAYLRRCGATETNTYSVDDIFHAVDSNLWVDEIVPALGFAHLTPATLSKVRITLSAAKKRRRSEAQPEPKEKDAAVTAAVDEHERAMLQSAGRYAGAGRQ